MCNQKEINDLLSLLIFSFSIVSGVAVFFIIILYLRNKEIRTLSFRILFYMSLTDLARSIGFLIPANLEQNKPACQTIAVILTGSFLVNAVWSIYIVFIHYQVYYHYPNQPKFYFKSWFFVAFFVAPSLQMLPLITDSYEFNQGTCTFSENLDGIIWRYIQEIIILASMIASVFIYVLIYIKYRHLKFDSFSEVIFEKGMIYCIIFIFTVAAVFIFRIAETLTDFCEVYILAYISYSFLCLHGFFNFLALIMNRNMRRSIKNLIRVDTSSSGIHSFSIIEKLINESVVK